MIGWTVVGHDWRTYMACDLETADGERVVSMVGPLIRLSASTNSICDIFKLLALMEGTKKYARCVYWPWHKNNVLEPLLWQHDFALRQRHRYEAFDYTRIKLWVKLGLIMCEKWCGFSQAGTRFKTAPEILAFGSYFTNLLLFSCQNGHVSVGCCKMHSNQEFLKKLYIRYFGALQVIIAITLHYLCSMYVLRTWRCDC